MFPTASPRGAIRRLAASRLVSITGGAAAFAALNFEIYRQTGSSRWLAVTLLLTFATGGLVMPLAGWVGDRFDRRTVMIVSDLAGAAVFGAMTFAHAPWVLVALGFVAAIVEAPFFAASSAAIPNLVQDEKDLGWANGLVAIGRNTGILLGPVLGGVLVASIGAQAVFAANGITFLLSSLVILTIHGRFREEGPRAAEAEGQGGLRVGISFVLSERLLRRIVLSWMVVVLGGGMAMVADVPLAEVFGAGAFGYGLMIAFWGGGTVLGALFGRRLDEGNELRWFVVGACLVGVMSAVAGLAPWFALVLGALSFHGFGDALMSVADQNILQRRTPDAIRSRVLSVADAAVTLTLALSFAIGGLTVGIIGPRAAYLVGGLTGVAAALLIVPLWRARRAGQPAPATEQPAEGSAGILKTEGARA
jgi:MFS family permease